MRRRRRVVVDTASLERGPDESFDEWRDRLHDEPVWLRAGGDARTKDAKQYLLDRADAIASGVVEFYSPSKGTGIRAV